jgi:fructuronate reductase
MRLNLETLDRLPPHVARPAFDPKTLKTGIVHLGVGNFHRAHQAVFTEDAIAKRGGDWGIIGVSLRKADVPHALKPQDNLYALESLDAPRRYRVMGVLRRMLAATEEPLALVEALAVPATKIVTLTITEKGYCLSGDGLNFDHPDIRHDLESRDAPRSAVGWIARALAARKAAGHPLTIVSCDNLAGNGTKLGKAVRAFSEARHPGLVPWIEDRVTFPNTMVDSIVPATDAAAAARIGDAIGLEDAAPVSREAFSQWVIEDRFAGARPAWEEVGVELVSDVAPFERLKLHVLNLCHSALAYLGLPRHTFVREAMADPELSRFADGLVSEEVAPALSGLDVASYWARVRARLKNPALDHRLSQIAEDGSAKLAQRLFPLLIENARAGRPCARMARVLHAWLDFAARGPVKDPERERLAKWAASGARIEDALADSVLFPDAFRTDEAVRNAVLKAKP